MVFFEFHTGQGRSQKKISGAIINFSCEFRVGIGIMNFKGREFQRQKIDKMINFSATESRWKYSPLPGRKVGKMPSRKNWEFGPKTHISQKITKILHIFYISSELQVEFPPSYVLDTGVYRTWKYRTWRDFLSIYHNIKSFQEF